uniref:Activator of 90 kDa heat shock protein ATPase homolog 1-like n=1 Tax=Hippocampus comes TaxID=109280 RepID=A0A3Q2YGY3_HIPCM
MTHFYTWTFFTCEAAAEAVCDCHCLHCLSAGLFISFSSLVTSTRKYLSSKMFKVLYFCLCFSHYRWSIKQTIKMILSKWRYFNLHKMAAKTSFGESLLITNGFTQGMILPTANGMVPLQSSSQSKAKTDKTQVAAPPVNTGVKIPTCKFSLTETFLTSPADLFRVFVNQEMIQAFTHAPATVEGEKGGRFRLLGGNVLGEFVDLVRDQKIVMKWRYNNWPCEHYATVTLTLVDRSSETELRLDCRGVPDDDEDRTKDGWRRFYFEAIKQTFGYGARLF